MKGQYEGIVCVCVFFLVGVHCETLITYSGLGTYSNIDTPHFELTILPYSDQGPKDKLSKRTCIQNKIFLPSGH